MTITFCTDVHGNGYAFKCFLQQQNQVNPDLIVFGGDVFGYYYDCNEILNLMRLDGRFKCILGNHDQMFLKLLSGEIDEKYLVSKYGNSYKKMVCQIDASNVEFLKTWTEKDERVIDGLRLCFIHMSDLSSADFGDLVAVNHRRDFNICIRPRIEIK